MVGAIKGGSSNLHPVVSGLDNCILLGMKATAEFMSFSRRDALFLTEATDIQAVFKPGGSSIVTRC
jgi:hypothetical protein